MSASNAQARRLDEIRACRLEPRTRADFHEVVTPKALPMVRAWAGTW